MRKADEISIKDYSIPGIVLMENAAFGVINEIDKEIKRETLPQTGIAVIVCGIGNNGGDGFAVARHLKSKGWYPEVFICGDEKKIIGDASINLEIIRKLGVPIILFEEKGTDILNEVLGKSRIVIDAILGTGFKGKLKPHFEKIVNIINNQSKYIISIDSPTGLNSDTGFAESSCIMADKTVTLGLPKIGLIINDGPNYCGELVVEGLSIPEKVYDTVGISRYLTDKRFVGNFIKSRHHNSHKGTYGRAFVVAGSKGMAGAGLLSSDAALRSGAGIVELAVPMCLLDTVSGKVPELITKGLSEDKNGCLCSESSESIIQGAMNASVLLVGPGLGLSEGVRYTVFNAIRTYENPIIIDADGLNGISENTSILLERVGETIVTPHPGEMARLMGISTKEVQQDRLNLAERFASKYKVIVVLKGFRTIIATPWGETWINPTGNPGMATAGSGDVLAGIIAGLIAQGLKAFEAAVCGTFIHGASGDRASENYGQWGMTATDIIRFIPHTIKDIGGM